MKAALVAVAAAAAHAAAAVVLPRVATALSSAQVAAFKPYSYFAGAGYCAPNATIEWTCGPNCDALDGFIPTATGGDGVLVQFWFVGYYPAMKSVVVAHQGTDTSKVIPLLNDADFVLDPLNTRLFPGLPSDIRIHSGFKRIHEQSAPAVLAAVKAAMAAHGTTKVTLASHSLGAALSLLDAVYLQLHLPASTSIKYVGYGVPRVGNPAWAKWTDAHVTDLTHINNKQDPVPILPGRFLGYQHPSGEIHINSAGRWLGCTGRDDESRGCTIDSVPTIFDGDANDHKGPYDGVRIECK